jgi:hypothetical protein
LGVGSYTGNQTIHNLSSQLMSSRNEDTLEIDEGLFRGGTLMLNGATGKIGELDFPTKGTTC